MCVDIAEHFRTISNTWIVSCDATVPLSSTRLENILQAGWGGTGGLEPCGPLALRATITVTRCKLITIIDLFCCTRHHVNLFCNLCRCSTDRTPTVTDVCSLIVKASYGHQFGFDS